MIRADAERQAEELLREGQSSGRAIARQTGLSRGTIQAMASGARPMDRAREQQRRSRQRDDRWGPSVQCPTCGGKVQMPCRLCNVRRLLAKGKLRRDRQPDPTDDCDLTIDLRDTDPERYLAVRHRKERKLLGALLADAEETACEDPRGDLGPTDAELQEVQTELERGTNEP